MGRTRYENRANPPTGGWSPFAAYPRESLLLRSVEQCHHRWGFWGFSVFEVPGGDYDQLARLRPIVAERRQLLVADAGELIDDGFPLLPTLDAPHWTVVLASATAPQFSRVRAHFDGPIANPSYRPRNR